MANFRYISEEQKKLILIMYLHGTCPKDIEAATGISTKAIWNDERSGENVASLLPSCIRVCPPSTHGY
ncbi:hypothetical protein BJV78DRAFT_1244010 [Lactifluus subvellereus]|nr:hypothetical protein BJV78DRAFT_1244010 [Lactifluus subvellereus]